MKKLLVILFILIGFAAQAQYPVNQSLGSPSTTTLIKGVTSSQLGLVVQTSGSDTSAVNSGTALDDVPGVLIRTADGGLWIRSQDAKKWLLILSYSYNNAGASTTIYADGPSQNTFFINPYRFLSLNQYLGPVTSSARIETEVDTSWYRITINGNVPGKTSGYFIAQSDSTNRMATVGLDPVSDSTTGFQALFTRTAATIGYRTGATHYDAGAVVKGISVDATTKVTISGLSLLLPRLTTAERTAIVSPDEGLAVYDTTLHKLYVWDGSTWQGAW